MSLTVPQVQVKYADTFGLVQIHYLSRLEQVQTNSCKSWREEVPNEQKF